MFLNTVCALLLVVRDVVSYAWLKVTVSGVWFGFFGAFFGFFFFTEPKLYFGFSVSPITEVLSFVPNNILSRDISHSQVFRTA